MSTAHWIFASRYFQLAVMLKLIYAHKSLSEMQKTEQKAKQMFIAAHIVFFSLIAGALVSGVV